MECKRLKLQGRAGELFLEDNALYIFKKKGWMGRKAWRPKGYEDVLGASGQPQTRGRQEVGHLGMLF